MLILSITCNEDDEAPTPLPLGCDNAFHVGSRRDIGRDIFVAYSFSSGIGGPKDLYVRFLAREEPGKKKKTVCAIRPDDRKLRRCYVVPVLRPSYRH